MNVDKSDMRHTIEFTKTIIYYNKFYISIVCGMRESNRTSASLFDSINTENTLYAFFQSLSECTGITER